ncbi:MAG: hypothetical protein KAU03_03530 [Candidatus Altiarchaeales archaeon]|nr:hypothetical protein [Candidatus Altiarchaeales archaeon]
MVMGMYPYADVIEKLVEAKVDQDFVEQTLQKLLERERFIIQNNLVDCQREMKVFEGEYGMSSDEFLERFNKGKLDDRDDYIKWFSLKDTYDRLKRLERDLSGENA